MIAVAVAALALAAGHDPVFAARANAVCDHWHPLLVDPPGNVGAGDIGDPLYDAAWRRVFDGFSLALRRLPPPRVGAREWSRALAALPPLRASAVALQRTVERHGSQTALVAAARRLELAGSAVHRHAAAAGATRCFPTG